MKKIKNILKNTQNKNILQQIFHDTSEKKDLEYNLKKILITDKQHKINKNQTETETEAGTETKTKTQTDNLNITNNNNHNKNINFENAKYPDIQPANTQNTNGIVVNGIQIKIVIIVKKKINGLLDLLHKNLMKFKQIIMWNI